MYYKKDRYEEIQDGKRQWSRKDDARDDLDVFFTQFVIPLRELKSEGMFQELAETKVNQRGVAGMIIFLRVSGAINLDFPLPDED